MAPARVNAEKQDADDELEMKVEKYSRGKGADLKALRDKKLRGQLAVKEKLYGQSAKLLQRLKSGLCLVRRVS